MNQKQIAEALNLSQATVSMALKGESRISREVTEKVLRFAEECGYQPGLAGRMLRHGKTNLIGILFPSMENPFFSSLFHELLQQFRMHGYIVYVSESNSDEETREAVRLLRQLNVAGAVAFGWSREIWLSENRSASFPLVLFDGDEVGEEEQQVPWIRSVRSDPSAAIAEMVDSFCLSGQSRPLLLAPSAEIHRCRVYAREWEKRSVAIRHIRVSADVQGGYRGMKQFLQTMGEKADCVFCYNDEIARGVLRACHETGVKVPDDMAVAGYDNPASAGYTVPSLSSIDLPKREIASALAAELLDLMKKREYRPCVRIPCSYMKRESVESLSASEML